MFNSGLQILQKVHTGHHIHPRLHNVVCMQNIPLHNGVHNPPILRFLQHKTKHIVVLTKRAIVPILLHGVHDDVSVSDAPVLDLLHRRNIRSSKDIIEIRQTFI